MADSLDLALVEEEAITYEEMVASVCHTVNRIYNIYIEDTVYPPWDELDPQHKDLLISGVNWQFNNPDCHPSRSHDKWIADKSAQGWTYGKEYDEENKKHPCMVQWNDLPDPQKRKDLLFKGICKALNPHVRP